MKNPLEDVARDIRLAAVSLRWHVEEQDDGDLDRLEDRIGWLLRFAATEVEEAAKQQDWLRS